MEKEIVTIDKKFFDDAVKQARLATCDCRSCGTVIVLDDRIIGSGFNHPSDENDPKCRIDFPVDFRKKRKSDITCCIHAEWEAFAMAAKWAAIVGKDLSDAVVYFASIDKNGNLECVANDDPYCTVCSRLAIVFGIGWWVLKYESGAKRFSAKEYDRLSYEYHKTQKSLKE